MNISINIMYYSWGKLCESGHTGASGNVLIDEKADRLSSYNIWDYAEGQDSYRKSMLVDLTQPPDKVYVTCYISAVCQHCGRLFQTNGAGLCSSVIEKCFLCFRLN